MKKKYLITIVAIVIVGGIVVVKLKLNSNEVNTNNENKIEQSSKTDSDKIANDVDKNKSVTTNSTDDKVNDNSTIKNSTSGTIEDNKNTKGNEINKSNNQEIKKTKPQDVQVKEKNPMTKEELVKAILRKELGNQSIPNYIIPVRALNNNYNNLEKFDGSNGFLCNDDGKLDNGIIVGLEGFNQSDNIHGFIIRDYSAIKNGGNGLVDKGTISNTGEVKFSM